MPPLSSVARALLVTVFTGVAVATPATKPCEQCSTWNVSQKPFHVYGNTYYVGVHGLSSLLITSPQGNILIDGDLPESAPKIAANIKELGFRIEDVKLILNSHVHFDHAGGIAALHRLSGAPVAASQFTAQALELGHSGLSDPQYGSLPPIGKVPHVRVIKDGETVHVGPLALTAHFTPGHTPGGTTWTWKSCEQERCLDVVYADSLSPVAEDNFRFTDSKTYPHVKEDFAKSFATLRALPCDIFLTPHPDVSATWERLQKRSSGNPDAFIDPTACKHYADVAQAGLEKRLAKEAAGGPAPSASTQ